jgi:virulence-associated protein VagC
MEKLKTFKTNEKRGYQQIAIPANWLREYLPDGGELELYQDGDKLVLTPKKNPMKAVVK